jgi:hypothetical protein
VTPLPPPSLGEEPKPTAFCRVVHHFLDETGLNHHDFANALNKHLPPQQKVPMIVVQWWEAGTMEPKPAQLEEILFRAEAEEDWQFSFALCALAVLVPDRYDLDGGHMFKLAEKLFAISVEDEIHRRLLAQVTGGAHV